MMQFNQSQRTIIQILNDGLCHSSNKISLAIGSTRAATWQQINQLINLGIPIIRIPQKGYQLTHQFILLDQQEITAQLKKKQYPRPFNIHLFTSIDSTNCFLKQLPTSSAIEMCCAEIQTQGRGRFGRYWYSPFGENIYCSSRWDLNCDLSQLSGLSLVVSLAILATIKQMHPAPDIKVKWPNDLLWRDKKLCGSLIEVIAESGRNAQIIIGIGLNVNTDTQNNPLPDKPWSSLYEITQQQSNRNILIANLMTCLERYLSQFIRMGLDAFLDEWNTFDYLKGKNITLMHSSGSIRGIASGINSFGQLILEDKEGTKHCFSSGDASLSTKPAI